MERLSQLPSADDIRALLTEHNSKAWHRSKVMIVGEGRAGKTALANSIMGNEFRHTDSTIGINAITLKIQEALVASTEAAANVWTKSTGTTSKYYEEEIARLVYKLSKSKPLVDSNTSVDGVDTFSVHSNRNNDTQSAYIAELQPVKNEEGK